MNYQTTIIRIGQSATETLSGQMSITFRKGAPANIEEFCFIHCHGELNDALQSSTWFKLDQHCYLVTVVSRVAEQNMRELRHITSALRRSARSEIFPASYMLRSQYRTISRRDVF